MDLGSALIESNSTFLCLFCFLDILLRHSQCSVYLLTETDDTHSWGQIVHILTSKCQLSHQQGTSSINRSFKVACTLKLYFFRIFLNICTFAIWISLIKKFFIFSNFQNHIALLFQFEKSKYFRLLHLYEQCPDRAFTLDLL
jgi:hypothetical protein